MKFRPSLLFPLLLASCSDSISGNGTSSVDIPPPPGYLAEKKAATTPSQEKTAPSTVKTSSPPPASASTTAPSKTLDFLAPDTTHELMTEAKRKTVTRSNAQLPPPPDIKDDGAIDIKPPEIPDISANR